MALRHLIVWNPTAGRIEVVQAGDEGYTLPNLNVGGTVDGRDLAADGTKLDLLTVTVPVDVDTLSTNVAASKAITDLLTATGAIDLDVYPPLLLRFPILFPGLHAR